MNKFAKLFSGTKPVITMVHLNPMPGTPLYNADAGIEGIYQAAIRDLKALQDADVDAVMFGNENDRPYELKVDIATTSAMAHTIGRLADRIRKPFGVNVLWDPDSTVALAAATGASFVREIFTGTYASDMGPWTPNAGHAIRRARQLDRQDLVILNNISAEFAHSLDGRSLADRARSAVFSSIPDAVLVSGTITGESARMVDLEAVKNALPDTPVLANTGVKHTTVTAILKAADGCIVGSSLKVDGHTWNPVDPVRAKRFMSIVKAGRD
ncbi:MAG: BtpA/SgcQ family protein [Qingshengfaniella sp.]